MIKNYNHIDSKRNCIIIRDAKGKKDRVTLLSQKALSLLLEYYRQYHPKEWLFEDAKGGKYSTTSLRKIFQRALEQSGIKKNVTLHSLSHSFANYPGTGDGSAVHPGVAGAPKFQNNGNLYPHNEERISESEISSG